ncbi:MAG: hypothetical protein BRD38_02320 [Bacteroidetes bacterium QH_9_67_14]|nr:MAG: hypothetical protein BRD38_02320 [Bacteroidetes bacterium QH_9_67_14]
MPQTLLSLGGLLIVTFLSFNQQQATIRTQQKAVRAEMQQMAIGVAKQSIEVVRARAFDDSTISGDPPPSELTKPENFPTGKDCRAFGGSDTCDSIEDFHEMTPATDSVSVPGGTFAFEIEIEVHYVDSDLNRTSSRTERKEVMIRVQDDRGPNKDPLLNGPITFTEVLGYT